MCGAFEQNTGAFWGKKFRCFFWRFLADLRCFLIQIFWPLWERRILGKCLFLFLWNAYLAFLLKALARSFWHIEKLNLFFKINRVWYYTHKPFCYVDSKTVLLSAYNSIHIFEALSNMESIDTFFFRTEPNWILNTVPYGNLWFPLDIFGYCNLKNVWSVRYNLQLGILDFLDNNKIKFSILLILL